MVRGTTPMRALAGLCLAASLGCGLFDFDVDLAQQTFTLDFGQQTGTMPTVACDASAGACDTAASFTLDTSAMAGTPSEVGVTLACDGSTSQCYAQVSARALTTVGVIQDGSFTSKIER